MIDFLFFFCLTVARNLQLAIIGSHLVQNQESFKEQLFLFYRLGFIDIEILREELQNWGEPITEIEFVDLPKVALKEKLLVFETGILTYPKFIERMNEKDDKFVKEPINFWKLDQKTLAAMALEKAMEERAEMEKREADRKAREEAKRQRMIEQGLIIPDEAV